MAKLSNDIIKFETNSYSSINQLFTKILGINNRSLTILQGLTEAMVTPDDYVEIILKNEKGENVLYQIPSITQISGKVVDMRATLDLLRQQKTLEYTEVEYNKLATYSEPNKIKTLPKLGNVHLTHPFDVVKIRARSVSEAGYPNNAVRGDWSEAIFVKFPNEFLNIKYSRK